MMDLITALFSGFLGALILFLLKEHVFKPKLVIEYEEDSFFHPVTKIKQRSNVEGKEVVTSSQAKYLRFRLMNKGWFLLSIPARNCRAYISKLTVVDENGKTSRMGEDWIPLSFSNSQNLTFLDLPTGVPQFVDILFTKQDHDHELIPSLSFHLKDYDLLRISGTFTIELSVVADNADVQNATIKFKWRAGDFDSLKALK